MKILISNDDGARSPGIILLSEAVQDLGEVIVVAPDSERSTTGHSLTLHKPLRIFQERPRFYSTTGSPADCIYLGIHEILKCQPDLILSGINRGANLGTEIHYSGTVAAAREGALMNIPSYAFSLVDLHQCNGDYPTEPPRYEMAAEMAKKVIEATRTLSFPPHSLLNVNIPNMDTGRIRGFRVTRQGFRYYSKEVTKRTDPRGKQYYWVGGSYLGFENGEHYDCHVVNEGWVSLTPVTIDCTHNEFYTTLKKTLE